MSIRRTGRDWPGAPVGSSSIRAIEGNGRGILVQPGGRDGIDLQGIQRDQRQRHGSDWPQTTHRGSASTGNHGVGKAGGDDCKRHFTGAKGRDTLPARVCRLGPRRSATGLCRLCGSMAAAWPATRRPPDGGGLVLRACPLPPGTGSVVGRAPPECGGVAHGLCRGGCGAEAPLSSPGIGKTKPFSARPSGAQPPGNALGASSAPPTGGPPSRASLAAAPAPRGSPPPRRAARRRERRRTGWTGGAGAGGVELPGLLRVRASGWSGGEEQGAGAAGPGAVAPRLPPAPAVCRVDSRTDSGRSQGHGR